MNQQIGGFGWRHSKTENSLIEPYLEIITDEPQIAPLHAGYEFSWTLSQEATCIGYSDANGYHKCPFRNPPINMGQCGYCSKQVGFVDAFFLGTNINDRMREQLSQPHVIYLAFFSPNVIKVGTALKSRRFVRTLEQDALVAAFIAESDGFTIQAIERTISKLGYPEAVSSSHKRRYLSVVPDPEPVLHKLHSAWQSISAKLASEEVHKYLYQFGSTADFEKQCVSHVDNPHLFIPPSDRPPRFLETVEHLTGEFRGQRGKFVIWEHNQKLYAVSRSRLVGRFFEVSSEVKTYSSPSTPTLFD